MARKRRFTNRRSSDVFVGGRPRSLDYGERREAARRQPNGGPPSMDRPRSRPERSPRTGPLGRLTGPMLALIAGGALLLFLVIWFFAFVYPSPIGGITPVQGSFVRNPTVDIKAKFSRPVKPGTVTLKVDGKEVVNNISVEARALACQVPLTDGKHEALLVVNGGGLMGRRTAGWQFTVDTTPPKLDLTEKKVTDLKGTGEVRVEFAGQTDPGSSVTIGKETLSVDAKGNFEGTTNSPRTRSLRISSRDGAGNEAAAFVVTQKPVAAKGVHVSIFIAASESNLQDMIGLTERTELNSLEIDLKDEAGQIGFDIDNQLAQESGAANDYLKLDSLVDTLRYHDVYTICRIVCFKDPKLPRVRPDLAVQSTGGGLWGSGNWLDPYSREVWDYNLAVAEAAARAGFNEVQFDYVRFPSDGDVEECAYPHQDGRTQGQVISDFLKYAREKLAAYNVFISADVFGLTASKQGEMNIGQKISDVTRIVDYLSPMMYPSHYNPGEYGIKSPENNPADTVSHSVDDFKKAMKGGNAGLRPWLQDFSLKVTYTPDMVRRQIDACENAGVKQWLLWDPNCTYSEEALKPQQKQK
ncbi:MAG: putative glycoside hydrolase [Actinobacteria bacterium]|nr:putative glycoside hydrolase [Actinomycetota bacterium]MBU1944425.1 putative glycoside hydrolase [Actinomycetota bacterium]MBU2688211.1 putative glycoside hydrolase [Actinomycetota bacterium]